MRVSRVILLYVMIIEAELNCESWEKGAIYYIPDWQALLNILFLMKIARV